MNDKKCASPNTIQCWEDIDFPKAKKSVKKLQKRIVLACIDGHYDKALFLQHKMIHSFYAKALAVKIVTSNKGKRTAGIDGTLWVTPEEKYQAIFLLNRKGYDYNYNYKYYDPNYDFATFARFYEIPNVALLDFLKNIEETIVLKQTKLDAYYQKVKSTVNDNKILSLMAERIANNYHFYKRKEIFESMISLFEEKKYVTFILTATIQIEGMFYDLITIRYEKKENQGTLVEKADKTFNRNSVQKQTLYPHFAFDLPELRNQVAHNGLVDNANIENFAYELILDLNCIVTLAEKESLDKFKTVLMMFEKMNKVNPDDFTDYDAYVKSVSKCLLSEVYMSNMMSNEYFWNLLSEPSNYEDELLFYLPSNPDKDAIYLKDAVLAISSFIRKEEFWQVVLEKSEHISEINYSQINDFGAFVEKLKNMFIPRLNGKAKELCCEVNKKLQSIINGK